MSLSEFSSRFIRVLIPEDMHDVFNNVCLCVFPDADGHLTFSQHSGEG